MTPELVKSSLNRALCGVIIFLRRAEITVPGSPWTKEVIDEPDLLEVRETPCEKLIQMCRV
jgi:hypothetical protein